MPQYSYAVGDSVQVTWNGKPYAGTVIRVGPKNNLLIEIKQGKERHQVIRLPDELKPLHAEPAA